MKFQTIQIEEREDKIGIIILNRPEKRNSISIQMRYEISKCLDNWKDSSKVGVVIITGAGPAFSAGFDLQEFRQPERFDEILSSSSKYHRDVWSFPKPVIAAVNGPAMGGGFDLAMFCDIRICSEKAVFGHPEIKLGAPPIFTPLKWIIGDGLARDLCLTGRKIDAKEAYRMGLVSEVVEENLLFDKAVIIASGVLEAPYETILFTKNFLFESGGRSFEESFSIEHDRAFKEILLKKALEGLK